MTTTSILVCILAAPFLTAFAIFLAGWVVGFIVATILAGQDADFGGVYNPVRYYRQMVQLQASPWSLLSPEL